MTIHQVQTLIDGVVVASGSWEDGGTPIPPPSGNPIIVPIQNPWNSEITNNDGQRGFKMYSTGIAAIEVPIVGQDVTLRIGQMPMSPPDCVMEFGLSVTPGVIPQDGTYQKIVFNNNFPYTVKGWTAGVLYLNMRWTYPPPQSGVNPGGFSVIWNF